MNCEPKVNLGILPRNIIWQLCNRKGHFQNAKASSVSHVLNHTTTTFLQKWLQSTFGPQISLVNCAWSDSRLNINQKEEMVSHLCIDRLEKVRHRFPVFVQVKCVKNDWFVYFYDKTSAQLLIHFIVNTEKNYNIKEPKISIRIKKNIIG